MARAPKPWWRADRKSWFVTIQGKRIDLGPDEKVAKRRFHEIMADDKPATLATAAKNGLLVGEIFERFLDWCSKHRAGRTYETHLERIQRFVDQNRSLVELEVGAFRPFHVSEWLDSHTDWSPTYRRSLISSIERAFNWALKLGYIEANPIRQLEKPAAHRREQSVTPEEWAKIQDHYPEDDPFRLFLEFLWETGCRPQEGRAIERRHIQLESHRLVFPKEESKGKKRPRVIYLTPRAEEVVRQAMAGVEHGPIFRNSDSVPWTPYSLNNRFSRLKKHLGVKYACYSLRHGFATRKLEAGLDHLTVAALMGHTDGTMLARVYSHVGDRQDHLHQQLIREPQKVTGTSG